MDTKGGKLRWGGDGVVLNWAIGIDMCTLMCIKLMPNKKKLPTNGSLLVFFFFNSFLNDDNYFRFWLFWVPDISI